MSKYPHLFSPLKIGKLTMRNRIESTPIAGHVLSSQGYLGQEDIAHFEMKAAGGAAIVTLGESFVHARTAFRKFPDVNLEDPQMINSLALLARAIKRHGAIPSIELQHNGKYGFYDIQRRQKGVPYGPSRETLRDGTQVFEMPEEMILEIVEAFGRAAAFVQRAGFEMALVHAGHGWLISQFLSPLENRRTDKFGGSPEKRALLALLIIESIRKNTGVDFPIEFRMNGDEFIPAGFGLPDAVELARMIDGRVDLIHVSAGNHEVPALYVRTHPSLFLPHGPNVYLAAEIKKHVRTPVTTVGGIGDLDMMEDILASGKADVIGLARALMADPYLPRKAAAGNTEEIAPCLRCFNGCLGYVNNPGPWTCCVNPVIGLESESRFLLQPPPGRKRVLIAGGGPGGMQAAITAAARGHQVTLCEKSGALGGQIKYARYVPFQADMHKYLGYLENLLRKSSAVIRLNAEVTAEFVAGQKPDVLIAAVGAGPNVPDIPGIDSQKVLMAQDAYGPDAAIGQKVVILGGGLVGVEEAINLAMKDKDVTVIEMAGEVARDANKFHRRAVMLELEKHAANLKVVTGTRGKAVTAEGLLCQGPNGAEMFYSADTIICAVGSRPLTEVVERLRGTAVQFYDIGDCKQAGKVCDAVRTGYETAMDL